MNISFKNNKGFTLIELLVVIAIISLLSAIVLANLNSARNRAKDAAAKQGTKEFEKLLALEYNDTGKYDGLQPVPPVPLAVIPPTDCNSLFGGSVAYAIQARNVCNNIFSNAGLVGGITMFVGNFPYNSQKYSIAVYLSNGSLFCVGSSGVSEGSSLYSTGCPGNP